MSEWKNIPGRVWNIATKAKIIQAPPKSEWKNIPGRVWNYSFRRSKQGRYTVRMEKHPWKGLKPHRKGFWIGWYWVRMEKHPWKGLKHHLSQGSKHQEQLPSEWKNIPGRVWNIGKSKSSHNALLASQNGKTSLEGFETLDVPCTPFGNILSQNGKTSLEGFETSLLPVIPGIIELPQSEWKNIPGRVWNLLSQAFSAFIVSTCQNGKTSLEGFETFQRRNSVSRTPVSQNGKTSLEGFETSVAVIVRPPKLWRSEWKNIPGRVWNSFGFVVKDGERAIVRMEKHPWKGLKPLVMSILSDWSGYGQNGKTSLEGFETILDHSFLFLTRDESEWKNIPGRVWNVR